MSEAPVSVGVAGLGYWGPNLARNLAALPGCELRWLCDPSEQARARAAPQFPGARVTGELGELLEDPELDAVVLATPVPSHAELAVRVARPASTASWRSRSRRPPPTPKRRLPRPSARGEC